MHIARWLLVCCAVVYALVVVGGVTRLTHSGLSITEWQPIMGTLPPLDEAQWESAFAKYRETPEFKQVNHQMGLDEFKGIFWWEYVHRLLGRTVGVVFLLPYLYFLVRRRIPDGYAWPLAGIFVLGGLQGALGWYMVQSGLVDDPRVSQFRLTAHLGLAVAILGAMLWTALSLLYPPRAGNAGARDVPRRHAFFAWGLAYVTLLAGGLVAGIRAGFAYNTWPSMNGHVVPPEILSIAPWWRNFFWNMATVQFDHRLLAYLSFATIAALYVRMRRATSASPRARSGAAWLLAMVCVQIALGIATVLLVVPIPLAALHQAGAVLVFALALNVAHAVRRGPTPPGPTLISTGN
ncbi:MAG: COX15/CtaA family protein [Proteobacteria bacterium]|nr:COX15/CtaA family protein [Pseudomonadota bacterium]